MDEGDDFLIHFLFQLLALFLFLLVLLYGALRLINIL